MVQSVMLDLHRSELTDSGYSVQNPIEHVVRDVGVPVRHLINGEVNNNPKKEGWSQSRPE
jgi:hypothetical protein